MGILRRKHAFRVSALSLSVPLNGCDTVLGLQELQRQKDGENFSRALQAGFYGVSGKPRTCRRYIGPYPSELTIEDLGREPRPWQDFAWGQGWQSYNLAEDISHLWDRVAENLVLYVPNYIRVMLGFILASMMWRPWSALGACIILAIVMMPPLLETYASELEVSAMDRLRAAGRRRWDQVNQMVRQTQGQQESRQNDQPAEQPAKDMQANWSYIACLFVAAYTNLLWVVARAVLNLVVLVLLHAAFRRAGTERDVAGGHASGVSLMEVLGFKRGRSDDPRRLLKEVGSLAGNVSAAAGLYAWHAAQSYCVNSLRYFRK